MDEGQVRKLSRDLGAETAAKLVEAGLDTPAKIRAATMAQLDAVFGKGKGLKAVGKK